MQTKNPNTQARDNQRWGLLLLSPWLLGLLIFKLLPILATLGVSFTDMKLLTPKEAQFAGLENYISIFTDANSLTVLLNTLKLALISVPLQTGLSVFLAALLSSEQLRFKNTLRVLFFIPSILPSAAAAFMWRGFLDARSGWMYRLILGPLGLAGVINFSTRNDATAYLVLISLWTIGPGILILMGAMQGISSDVREAALVDGAGRLRRFFLITLPMVSPAVFFTIILNLTAVFGGAIMMDRGYSFNSSLSSYDAYIYNILFRLFQLGSAASVSWIFFLFTMVLVLLLFVTAKYWVYYPDAEAES